MDIEVFISSAFTSASESLLQSIPLFISSDQPKAFPLVRLYQPGDLLTSCLVSICGLQSTFILSAESPKVLVLD
jgi:hypothetical protein